MNFDWIRDIEDWTKTASVSWFYTPPVTTLEAESGVGPGDDWRAAFDTWGSAQSPWRYRQLPYPFQVAPGAQPRVLIERWRPEDVDAALKG